MGYTVRPVLRPLLLLSLPLFLAVTPTARAASSNEVILDSAALLQLEARAQAAQPREQCFLYTELVNNLTELAGRQLAAGQDDEAGATLRHIDMVAQRIHMALARDTKRLKNAELLLHHTTRRLSDMLHAAPGDDRPVLQSTLQRLDTVQTELLNKVFEH